MKPLHGVLLLALLAIASAKVYQPTKEYLPPNVLQDDQPTHSVKVSHDETEVNKDPELLEGNSNFEANAQYQNSPEGRQPPGFGLPGQFPPGYFGGQGFPGGNFPGGQYPGPIQGGFQPGFGPHGSNGHLQVPPPYYGGQGFPGANYPGGVPQYPGGPQPGFGGPQPGFGGPQPGFGGPQPGFGGPRPGFGGPQPGFGPQGGFNGPNGQYQVPPPYYGGQGFPVNNYPGGPSFYPGPRPGGFGPGFDEKKLKIASDTIYAENGGYSYDKPK